MPRQFSYVVDLNSTFYHPGRSLRAQINAGNFWAFVKKKKTFIFLLLKSVNRNEKKSASP